MPVCAASAVRVTPRFVRSRFRRGPTSARTSGMAGVRHGSDATGHSQKRQRRLRPPSFSGTVEPWIQQRYDVAVVGGGAAGLSAALVLGRARRRVVVIDAGAPRNAPAAHMQGFLSRDGMPPADLLASREKKSAATASRSSKTRSSRSSRASHSDSPSGRSVTARRLLLATGAVDELPDIPGARERWGRDFLHCPYCHGWEVRDQAIGVLGTDPGSVDHAQLLRQWSDDVVFFSHSHPSPASERAALDARGIAVIEGTVTAFSVVDDRLHGGRAERRPSHPARRGLHAAITAPAPETG